jgi:hypothetical protein
LDFYEVGVYLVIVVVASACVFGVMWLLLRSMQPKRKPKRKGAPALAAAVNGPKQIAQGSSAKAEESAKKRPSVKEKTSKKEKKEKIEKKDKLLELKDLPDSRLLAKGQSPGKDAIKQGNPGFLLEPEDNQKPASENGGRPNSGQDKQPEIRKDSEPVNDEEEMAAIDLPDLPSMDTLGQGDEEAGEQKDEVDLMSVFETEETEDSSTADLAANLFDVDVQNIEKLSSEVAEFLGGMRAK